MKDLRAMRSTRPHGRLRAARLFCLALIAGCASSTPLPAPVPENVTRPHVLTDLSSLSTAPTTTLTNLPSGPAPAPSAATESSHSQASNPQRFFLAQPGRERITGKASAPAYERLLNAKAEKFGEFSSTLLHQVLVAATVLEHGEMETKVVPDNVNPVIITAIMNKDGKLKELIVEQHSGSGALDHLMVEACKQGLWTGNPPPEAMTDGEYRIRIEGRLKNFSTSDQKHWEFETHVGLGLL